MNLINNSWDVYINLCRGGGFELGHIETAASGVPSIGVDFTSMPELIEGHGWLVKPYGGDIECPHCKKDFSYNGGARQFSHLMSTYCIPDEYKAADAISDAYSHPNKTKKFGADSRKFALGYDYNTKIVPKWLDLFDEVRSELGMIGVAQNKQKGFDELYKELA
jgi:glycosyltransferase involved in cell wall biosynthesis